jgi:hypothetical protein
MLLPKFYLERAEPYQKMVMVSTMVATLSTSDIDEWLEMRLVDRSFTLSWIIPSHVG